MNHILTSFKCTLASTHWPFLKDYTKLKIKKKLEILNIIINT